MDTEALKFLAGDTVLAPPLTVHRFLYTARNQPLAHILVGYTPITFRMMSAMTLDLLDAFPGADGNQVSFGKVTASQSYKGFVILSYPLKDRDSVDKDLLTTLGWRVVDRSEPDYSWG